MEWEQRGSLLREEDLNVLKFRQMKSYIFSGLKNRDKTIKKSKELASDEDWTQWLDEKQNELPESRQSHFTFLIVERAKTRIPGTEVSYLPFSKPICERVTQAFQIHRSISRVINRNTTATFLAINTNYLHTNRPTLFYNCRSSCTWPDDLALSITYSPYEKSIRAVLYGCGERARATFTNRLSRCDFVAYHPLMLPTIFAEVERDRHFDIVNPLITELVGRVVVSDVPDAEGAVSNQTSQATQASEHYIQSWLEISWLKNGLENWRQELEKMILCCDELRRANFHDPNRDSENSTGSTLIRTKSVEHNKEENAHELHKELAEFEESGTRIEQRLLELKVEYDEKIRACETIIDGMVLAAQLDWNKIGRADTKTNLAISTSNLEIAKSTKMDGRRMRTIAVLTIIFLPATFVATVFSMTFFDWNPEQGQTMMSPYIWIYIASAAILTGLTITVWHLYNRRKKGVDCKDDPEKLPIAT